MSGWNRGGWNGFNSRNIWGDHYGLDTLSYTMAGAAVVLAIAYRFFPRSFVLPIIGMALIVLVFLRTLSKNIVMRRSENERFLTAVYAVRDWFLNPHFGRLGGAAAGGYRTFRCPRCGQKCRVPRGKGRIAITCPKCGQDFIKRT